MKVFREPIGWTLDSSALFSLLFLLIYPILLCCGYYRLLRYLACGNKQFTENAFTSQFCNCWKDEWVPNSLCLNVFSSFFFALFAGCSRLLFFFLNCSLFFYLGCALRIGASTNARIYVYWINVCICNLWIYSQNQPEEKNKSKEKKSKKNFWYLIKN